MQSTYTPYSPPSLFAYSSMFGHSPARLSTRSQSSNAFRTTGAYACAHASGQFRTPAIKVRLVCRRMLTSDFSLASYDLVLQLSFPHMQNTDDNVVTTACIVSLRSLRLLSCF